MSNILLINSQDYDDDDMIAGNVIVDDNGHVQEITINVQEAERGPQGEGIIAGGNPGQIMVKQSPEDYDIAWENPLVTSVNGKTGGVVLNASDVGAMPDSTVIPKVNDGKLTVKRNGETITTFTANQKSDTVADINVPTKTSELENNSGFVEDPNYVHTDNNFNNGLKNKLSMLADIKYIGNNLSLRPNGTLDATDQSSPKQVYRGPNQPTSSDVLIWIDTSEVLTPTENG